MAKSKLVKLIIAILIAIILFFVFSQNTFSLSYDISTKFADVQVDKSNANNTISVIFGKAINFLQIVGAGIAIIMLVVIGIRWMSAAPSGKAQVAKTSRYYIMGAVFIFAAIALLQLIKNFTNSSVGSL